MSSLSPKSEPGEPPQGTPTNPAVPPPPLAGQVPGATPQMWRQAPGPPPAHETGPAWGFRAHSLPVYLLSHFLPSLPPACLSVCSQGTWLPPAPGKAWCSLTQPPPGRPRSLVLLPSERLWRQDLTGRVGGPVQTLLLEEESGVRASLATDPWGVLQGS